MEVRGERADFHLVQLSELFQLFFFSLIQNDGRRGVALWPWLFTRWISSESVFLLQVSLEGEKSVNIVSAVVTAVVSMRNGLEDLPRSSG